MVLRKKQTEIEFQNLSMEILIQPLKKQWKSIDILFKNNVLELND